MNIDSDKMLMSMLFGFFSMATFILVWTFILAEYDLVPYMSKEVYYPTMIIGAITITGICYKFGGDEE